MVQIWAQLKFPLLRQQSKQVYFQLKKWWGVCIFSVALKLNGAGELSLFSQGLFNKQMLVDLDRDTGSLRPAGLPCPLAERFPPWFTAIRAAALLGRTQDSMVVTRQTLLRAGEKRAQAAGAAGKVNTRNRSGGKRDRSLMKIFITSKNCFS